MNEHNLKRIIILHGIIRTKASMAGLARYLESAKFDVLNIGYPSTNMPMSALADHVYAQIEAEGWHEGEPIALVGYSLGSQLIRILLAQGKLANTKRVVMLAPPNHGSEMADFWKHFAPYRWLFGRAGQQLGTDQHAVWRVLPERLPDGIELGVIAGNVSWDPFARGKFTGEHDGKVSVESTKLDGMQDYIVLPTTHTFMIHREMVWQQVRRFLETGRFRHGR